MHGVQPSAAVDPSPGRPRRAKSRSSSCHAYMSSSCSPSGFRRVTLGASRVRRAAAGQVCHAPPDPRVCRLDLTENRPMSGDLYEFGPYRFDPRKRVLWRGSELVRLPPKAADILLALLEQGGDLVS